MLIYDDFSEEQQEILTQALQAALALADTFPLMLPCYSEVEEKPTEAMCNLTTEFIRHVLHESECPMGWELMLANILFNVHFVMSNMYQDILRGDEANSAKFYGVVITTAFLDRLWILATSFRLYFLKDGEGSKDAD